MKRVTFETAKLAKEVGFNRITRGGYSSEDKLCEDFYIKNDEYEPWIAAPYQAELQEWLRNEHGIHINVDWFCNNPSEWDYQISKTGQEDESGATVYLVNWGKDRNFVSYEDALEEALKQSCKLLINKNESK